jgi:hypothetical protein
MSSQQHWTDPKLGSVELPLSLSCLGHVLILLDVLQRVKNSLALEMLKQDQTIFTIRISYLPLVVIAACRTYTSLFRLLRLQSPMLQWNLQCSRKCDLEERLKSPIRLNSL